MTTILRDIDGTNGMTVSVIGRNLGETTVCVYFTDYTTGEQSPGAMTAEVDLPGLDRLIAELQVIRDQWSAEQIEARINEYARAHAARRDVILRESEVDAESYLTECRRFDAEVSPLLRAWRTATGNTEAAWPAA